MRWQALVASAAIFATRVEATCAWRPTDQLTISGDVEQGGIRGSFERRVAPASGRFIEAIDLGTVKTGSGFDGQGAWSRDVSGASHYLTSVFAKRLAVSEAWLTGHLSCPPVRSGNATRIRTDGVANMVAWRFVPTGGAPIELWYDDRTGRLDRAVLQYSENRIIHHFADWHKVMPGRLMPFFQRDEDPEDQSEQVYTVRKVARRHAGAPFRPPPAPNDTKILGGSSTVIPFEDDQRHRVFVPIYLDGKGPFTFELDNGGHFILTEATAAALGLKAQGSFASTGAGTQVRHAGYLAIDELKVGSAVVTHQTAKVLPLSHNDRPGLPPRAGILGLEFFERFIVAIDHRTKTVSLRLMSDRRHRFRGKPLPITFDEDAPLTAGGYDGAFGNVMLDIGNAGPTIVEHFWAARHGFVPALSAGRPRGSAKLSQGRVSLGPFTLRHEPVVYFGPAERGSEHTQSVALMVGEPLLSRFNATYDYGRQVVWLEPLAEMPPVSVDKR